MKLLRQRISKTVVVTLDNGESFRGAFYAEDRDWIVLRNAGQLDPRSDTQFVSADGELLLPKQRVTCCQFP